MQPKPAGGTYGALWIEMKSENGRLTKPQKWWRDNLLRIGHAHAICRSWTEGRHTMLAYLDGTLKTPWQR